MDTKLNRVTFTPLKQFSDEKGVVKRMMRTGDVGYNGLEEVYCSSVEYGVTKGWKKHKKMTLNLCVVSGSIEFYVLNENQTFKGSYKISKDNYGRLTIPPLHWVAFKGLDVGENILINMADMVHDATEFENAPLSRFNIG